MRVVPAGPTWLLIAIVLVLTAAGPNGWGEEEPGPGLGAGREAVLSIDSALLEELSEEEQDWYRRFHDGVMFFDGWADISQRIIDTFPPEERTDKRHLIQRLGIKIGTEWCRSNRNRKIDTDKLQQWGRRIRSAVQSGPEAAAHTLREIENEVDQLLSRGDEVVLAPPRP